MAMAMNPFLLGFIAFLVLVTILLLFGQASFCRTWLPCVPFLHDLLFSHLPQALYHLSPPWIHRMAARCEAAADSRNPVLQIFYLILVCGCTGMYLFSAAGRMTSDLVPFYHCIIYPCSIMATLIVFRTACVSDPGIVSADNVDRALQIFPYDHILFTPKTCRTCGIIKPARSKHCRVCKVCVAKMDHHCAWINNCVGHYNYRYFLAFLLSTHALSVYTAYLAIQALRHEVERRGIARMWVYDQTEARNIPISNYMIFMVVSRDEIFFTAVAIFSVLIAVTLILFFFYQLSISLRGKTTNEMFKWEDLQYSIQCGDLKSWPQELRDFNQSFEYIDNVKRQPGRNVEPKPTKTATTKTTTTSVAVVNIANNASSSMTNPTSETVRKRNKQNALPPSSSQQSASSKTNTSNYIYNNKSLLEEDDRRTISVTSLEERAAFQPGGGSSDVNDDDDDEDGGDENDLPLTSVNQSSFNNDNSINADYNDEDDDDAVSSSSSLTDEMSLMQYEEDSDENNSAPVSVIGGKRPLKHANNSSNGNNPSSKSVKSLMWSSRFGGKSTTMQHSDDMNRNGSPSTSLSSYCICNGKYDSSEYMVSCFECQEWFHARCVKEKVPLNPATTPASKFICKQCNPPKRHKSGIFSEVDFQQYPAVASKSRPILLPSSTSDSEGNFLFSDSSDDDDNDALPPPPTSDHHHYHHEQQLHSKTANNSRSKAMKTPRNAVVVPTATALNNHAGNTLSTTTVCKPLKKSSGRKSQKAPRSSSSSAAAAAPVAASRKKKSDNTINIVTPVVHLIPTPSTMQENEDEDDICPVCDGDCTCQSAAPSINTTSIINTTAITLPPTPIVISSSSMNQNAAKRNSVTSSAKQITLKAQPVTSTISSQSKTAAAASTTTSKAKGSSRATKSGTTSNRNTSKTKSKSKLKAAAVSEAVTAAAIATKEANSATAAAVAAATAAQEEVDAQIAVAMSLDIIKNENEKRHVAVPSKHGNRDDGWIVKDVDKNNNNKEDKMDLDFMSALDAAFSGLISEDEENETSNSKPSSSSTFKNTSSTAASNITTATNINGNDESRRGYGISSSAFGDIHGLGLGIDETTGDHYLVQLVNENDFMQLVKDEGDDQDSLFSSDEDLLLFYPDDEEGDDDEENHQDNNMMDEDEIVGQFMMAGGCGWSSDEEEDYKIYRLFQADENDDHVLFLADESPEDDEDNNSVLSNESYTADVGLESQSSLLHSSSIAGGSANNQLGPNTIPDVVVHPPIIEPPPEPLPPPSLSYDIKKTQVGPNGELITTTKTIAFKMTPKTLSSSNKKGKKGSAKAAAANTTFDVGSSSCKPSGAGPSQVGGVISHQQPLSAVSLPIPSQLHLQQQTPTLFPMLGTQPLNPFLSNPASAAALQAAAASILKNYGHPAATGSATSSTSAYASLAAINPFAAAAAMIAASNPQMFLSLTEMKKQEIVRNNAAASAAASGNHHQQQQQYPPLPNLSNLFNTATASSSLASSSIGSLGGGNHINNIGNNAAASSNLRNLQSAFLAPLLFPQSTSSSTTTTDISKNNTTTSNLQQQPPPPPPLLSLLSPEYVRYLEELQKKLPAFNAKLPSSSSNLGAPALSVLTTATAPQQLSKPQQQPTTITTSHSAPTLAKSPEDVMYELVNHEELEKNPTLEETEEFSGLDQLASSASLVNPKEEFSRWERVPIGAFRKSRYLSTGRSLRKDSIWNSGDVHSGDKVYLTITSPTLLPINSAVSKSSTSGSSLRKSKKKRNTPPDMFLDVKAIRRERNGMNSPVLAGEVLLSPLFPHQNPIN